MKSSGPAAICRQHTGILAAAHTFHPIVFEQPVAAVPR
eukprot:CAMPEP_0195024644 /NCGR_PEP_ID=MMETSP0326_2-20130528/45818_1 /TAXON_ID=2866 ORGANISM="Crypthecodinium cohnii, Strain Seligo" /NCGR_SAMPLE_ID=MMETSP0326_2 /ASSEMBLY_ACC=CAM_ASM_000348 /LENGTH=37 /DNA_ID= /DNA_START= /DNA_END= /DNA_ORIENTATION=